MKLKRVLSIVVSALLAATLFAGCGPAQKPATSSAPEKASSAAQPEETVKLTWYAPGEKQADHDVMLTALNKMLKDKINVELDLQVYDWGTYNDKLNMLVSTQADFDLCFTSNWYFIYSQNVAKGAFLELDDLMNTAAPKLKTAVPAAALEIAKVNGKTYAIPNYQSMAIQRGFYVPTEIAKKYNFDLSAVKTYKDIEPLLKSVKEGEADIYPYYTNMYPYEFSYERVSSFAAVKRDDSELKVVNLYESDEFKDYITTMADWYSKGYIRKDIESAAADQSADYNAGKYAVMPGSINFVSKAQNEKNLNMKLDVQSIEIPYISANASQSTMTAVSKTSKNPEKAIQLIELVNTDKDVYNCIAFGVEGTHYDKVSDNQIKMKADSKYNPQAGWIYGNTTNAFYQEGEEIGLWDKVIKLDEDAQKSPMMGFAFNAEPVKDILAKVSAVEQEYVALNYGTKDIDKTYPEFISKLKAAGADELVAECQKQLDAWKTAK